MKQKSNKPSLRAKLCWGLVYAVLCLAEFLIGWAKSNVEKQLKGAEPEKVREDG